MSEEVQSRLRAVKRTWTFARAAAPLQHGLAVCSAYISSAQQIAVRVFDALLIMRAGPVAHVHMVEER